MDEDQQYIKTLFPGDPDSLVILKHPHRLKLFPPQPKILPNFIIYDQDIGKKASFYKSAINAMKLQKTNELQIINAFCQVLELYSLHDDSKITQRLKSLIGKDKPEYILQLYAEQSCFYKVLNNILRDSPDVTQIFYVQPFVKKMFKAIFERHSSYGQQKKVFKCYRGGYMHEEQLKRFQKGKGKYVQSLGFLSTSLSKYVARGFQKNVFIQILVSEEAPVYTQHISLGDQGYVYMSELSGNSNKWQEEILFNVNSTFEIQDAFFHSYQNVFLIKLKYGKQKNIQNQLIKNPVKFLLEIKDKRIVQYLTIQFLQKSPCQRSAGLSDISNINIAIQILKYTIQYYRSIPKTQINSFILVQIVGQLIGLFLIANKLEEACKIINSYSKLLSIQLQPEVNQPVQSSSLLRQKCWRYCFVTDFTKKCLIQSIVSYKSGNFSKCMSIIKKCENFLKRVNKNIINDLQAFFTIYFGVEILKFMCEVLDGYLQKAKITFSQIVRDCQIIYGVLNPYDFILGEIQQKIFCERLSLTSSVIQLNPHELTSTFIGLAVSTHLKQFYDLVNVKNKQKQMNKLLNNKKSADLFHKISNILSETKLFSSKLIWYFSIKQFAWFHILISPNKIQTVMGYLEAISIEAEQWSQSIRDSILTNIGELILNKMLIVMGLEEKRRKMGNRFEKDEKESQTFQKWFSTYFLYLNQLYIKGRYEQAHTEVWQMINLLQRSPLNENIPHFQLLLDLFY